MQTMKRVVVLEEARAPEPPEPEPRRASALDVFVTIVVCLSLWALLAAPLLERNAEAGPIGARRSAALALLRPLVAISNALLLSRATSSIERALGRDPQTPPGGELALPVFEIPADAFEPTTHPPGPTERPDATHTSPPPARGNDEEEAVEGPAAENTVRTPSRSNKLRVAVIGDSLSQGLGPAIERWMDPGVARVLSLGRPSTGLSREDYFNWQAGMRQIVEEFRPDLVFVMLGSNDAQAQISRDGAAIAVGSEDWVEGYRDRAAELLEEATRAGTHVVWVGIPIVKERERWDFYRRVNDIYRDTANADPFGTYVDTWEPFQARDGGYTAFVRNERGDLVEVRAPDGVHFTPTGYSFIGRMAIRAADDAFGMPENAVSFHV